MADAEYVRGDDAATTSAADKRDDGVCSRGAADWHEALGRTFAAWNGRYVVTSPDVDGLLSACLVLERYPQARLVGLYDTRRVVLLGDGTTWAQAREALWVDLDVLQRLLCIGQHLVQKSAVADRLPTRHAHAFNPNVHFGQAHDKSFQCGAGGAAHRDKYPFGTVHLLMHYFGIREPRAYVQPLVAHADGAWINAVKYADNCRQWAALMFAGDGSGDGTALDALLRYTQGDGAPERLAAHERVVTDLRALLGRRHMGASRTTYTATERRLLSPQWLALKGNQSVECAGDGADDVRTWLVHVKAAWDYVVEATGWAASRPPLDIALGGVRTGRVAVVPQFPRRDATERFYPVPKCAQTLDTFVEFAQVFSMAIIGQKTLRYTCNLDLRDDDDDGNNDDDDDATAQMCKRRRTCDGGSGGGGGGAASAGAAFAGAASAGAAFAGAASAAAVDRRL